MPKVVIVGAGISGLALAFRLQQLARDIDLTILEQRNRPGGTIWTEHRDGFVVEIGPNGFLDTKPSRTPARNVFRVATLGYDVQLGPFNLARVRRGAHGL